MTLPASGPISMSQINVEMGELYFKSNSSIKDASTGAGGYDPINQYSVSKPDGSAPFSYTEFYSYNHTTTAPPVASFSANYTTVDGTETPTAYLVTFTDSSSPAASSWKWWFDYPTGYPSSPDSTAQNPNKSYTPGSTVSTVEQYSVALRATNVSGYDDEIKTNYITVYPLAPIAPSAPSFASVTTTSFYVNWTDNSLNEGSFLVYYSGSGTSGWQLHSSPSAQAGTGAYTGPQISGLDPDKTYGVYIAATNDGGTTNGTTAYQKTNAVVITPVAAFVVSARC